MTKKPIIIIAGPTASGKSDLANKIADKYNSTIINGDALQIYADIPIVSAQPTPAQKKKHDYKLYGYVGIHEYYSVAKWLDDAITEIENTHNKNKLPIVDGGSGMYLKSLVYGLANIPTIEEPLRKRIREFYNTVGKEIFYQTLLEKDPMSAKKLNVHDKQRVIRAMEVFEQTGKSIIEWQAEQNPHFSLNQFLMIFIDIPREQLYKRCNDRFLQMIEDGAIDEVEYLIKNNNYDTEASSMKAVGIRELGAYLEGMITLNEAIELSQNSTRKYAKRQLTWFRNQMKDIKRISYDHSPESFNNLSHELELFLE